MRIMTCNIRNAGNGDITWVDDHLDHGVWSDGKGPSESTNVIKPGETRTFEAVSGGDIPLIGSIGTGTEGWALFRTLFTEFVGMPGTAFIKVHWNIPFFTFDWDDGAKFETTRFDPRQSIGPGQFDDRDKTPPGLQISGIIAGPGGGDHVIDGLPWVFICPPMVISGAKIGVNMTLVVNGTAAPSETKIPSFSDKKNVKPIPEPMMNTNASMWSGLWSGDSVSARISRDAGNMLSVTITENGSGGSAVTFPSQTVSISRLVSSYVDVVRGANFTELTTSGESYVTNKVKLYVQEGLGTSRPVSKLVDRRTKLYKDIVSSRPDVVANFANLQHQIGGDYLSLQPDATLEIYRMVAKGEVVDVALRYRRPASIPMIYSTAHLDEMLYFRPDLH